MQYLGTTVLAGLAVLAALAGVAMRWRVLRRTGRIGARLSDQDMRDIEESGTLTLEEDDPLDLDEVREAEERFWSETWDEADEL